MFVLRMHLHQNTLQMSYTLLKALHIIFVVTWFAGLFYMFRLFVYHREAQDQTPGPVREALIAQFRIMERRLWFAITWPSSILTLAFGFAFCSSCPVSATDSIPFCRCLTSRIPARTPSAAFVLATLYWSSAAPHFRARFRL